MCSAKKKRDNKFGQLSGSLEAQNGKSSIVQRFSPAEDVRDLNIKAKKNRTTKLYI